MELKKFKGLALVVVLMVAFIFVASNAFATTRYVRCWPQTYQTIQAAVDDAQDGDSIHVCCAGCSTYSEYVEIDGFNGLFIGAVGCAPSIIIDCTDTCNSAGGCSLIAPVPDSGFGFHIINSSNVRITGFTIVGFMAGIWAQNSSNLNIHNNDIEHNGFGIVFATTHSSIIEDNSIHANDDTVGLGIYLYGSDRNRILHNVISRNGSNAFWLDGGSDSNFVSRNTIFDNGGYGGFVSNGSAFNAIWSNCFYRNRLDLYPPLASPQAFDAGWTGGFRFWDNYGTPPDTIGNYWNEWDYAGGLDYPIEGPSPTNHTFDRYPKTTTVKIVPPHVEIPPSHIDTVWIRYEPGCFCCPHQHLFAYQLKLVFDSRYLDLIEVSPGEFPDPNFFWHKYVHTDEWDTLYITQSCLGDSHWATSKCPIMLADLVFHGKKCSEVELPIRIVEIELVDHPYKAPIAVHTEPGFIKVLPECLSGFKVVRGKDGFWACWKRSPCFSHWGAYIRKIYWGDYPLYREPGPPCPSDTTGGFFLHWGPGQDTCIYFPEERKDIFCLTAWAWDDHGNLSFCYLNARATSYILGDLDSSGHVDFRDLVIFAKAYGTCMGEPGWNDTADIAPTVPPRMDDGIPNPDSCIGFEDLLIFAQNFCRVPNWPTPKPTVSEPPLVVDISSASALAKGEVFETNLLIDNANGVKALHLVLDYDKSQLELVGVTPGELTSDSRIFFWAAPNEIDISVAALSKEMDIGGKGEVATLKFKVLREGPVELSAKVLDVVDVNLNSISCTFNKGVLAQPGLPSAFALAQNYPNPFNPETYISFALPIASSVNLKIYNVAGQLVKTLVDDQEMRAGTHAVRWDCTNNSGEKIASGIYFYKMVAGDFSAAKKMVITK